MYCRKCGNKIDEDSKFCTHCGEQTHEATSSLVNEVAEEAQVSETKVEKREEKNSNTMLKIIEVILWVGAGLVLLNLFLDEIDWFLIISAEVLIFSGIAYIREWIKNFEVPLVLMILGLINNVVALSLIDILLYVAGIYGLILKRKEYED